jgi:hypothetical protein
MTRISTLRVPELDHEVFVEPPELNANLPWSLAEACSHLHPYTDDYEGFDSGPFDADPCECCGLEAMDEYACPDNETECLDCCECGDH